MIVRRLIASLALLALTSNLLVLARPIAGGGINTGGQAFTLLSLKHETVGALTRILIESNAPPLYTVLKPADHLILVDLPGSDGANLATEYPLNNSLVDRVAVRKGRTGGGDGRAVTRIEIALRSEVRDRSRLDGNTLVIELSPEKAQQGNLKPTAQKPEPAFLGAQRPSVYVQPVPVSEKSSETHSEAGTERAQPRASELRPATLVQSVRPELAGGGLRVVVETNGAAQFKDFMLQNPWRLVVDVMDTRSAFGNKTMSVSHALVDRVRVGQPSPNVTRVVLDMKSKLPYNVTREGASVVITVGNADSPRSNGPSATQAPQNREVKVAGERVDNDNRGSQDRSKPSSITVAEANRRAAGASDTSGAQQPRSSQPDSVKETIVQTVATSHTPPATPPAREVSPPATRPDTAPARPAETQNQSVRSQLAFCDPAYVGGLVSFDLREGVDLRDMLRFISHQYGVNFIVDKSVGPVPVNIRVTDMPWNRVMESVMRANRLGAVCESDGLLIRIATLAAVKEEEEQRRAIEEEKEKRIPLITRILNLKYARAFGSLGAAGSGASGGGGSSSASRGGGGGAGGQNQGTMLSIAEKRLSPRGRIEMDSRTNSLIVTDLPEYVAAIEDIINKLDQPEPQVEIEARIVIASRNFLRDIGVELVGAAANLNKGTAGIFETTPVTFNPGTGISSNTGSGGAGGSGGGSGGSGGAGGGSGGNSQNQGLGPNLPGPIATDALRAAANTVLSLTTGAIGTGIISTALTASETKGQIRTIASPRITAQDNQTAEIVNGVQIPVQTVSNNTITTSFVTAALRLEITPQIIEETGEVLMHVVAENNTVNFNLANSFNNGTPGINTQAAQSTVRIQDGGTTVMGGINIDTEGHTENRTPGVSRIPVIGELFKRRSTRREFDEILFFITPRIVRGDGTVGPRTLAPSRSSVEGSPNPAGTQRATSKPDANKGQSASQPAGKIAAGKEGQ